MSEIKVSGLSHVYSADTPFEKIAIDNVNVEIPHGQLVGLIGHTGSGKSTFIQHLNGLLVPSSGTVLVDSVNINGDKAAARDVRSSSMSRRPDLTLPAVREYLKRSATTAKRQALPLSSSATAWMTLHA